MRHTVQISFLDLAVAKVCCEVLLPATADLAPGQFAAHSSPAEKLILVPGFLLDGKLSNAVESISQCLGSCLFLQATSLPMPATFLIVDQVAAMWLAAMLML